jgi:hypothetical protein
MTTLLVALSIEINDIRHLVGRMAAPKYTGRTILLSEPSHLPTTATNLRR